MARPRRSGCWRTACWSGRGRSPTRRPTSSVRPTASPTTASSSTSRASPRLAAPPATIDIVYYNDGRDPVSREDLNLFIDAIALGDRVYESEIDGFFTPDNFVAGREGPREALWWNGVLSFELDDALIA